MSALQKTHNVCFKQWTPQMLLIALTHWCKEALSRDIEF